MRSVMYSILSSDQIKEQKLVWNVTNKGEKMNAYRILVVKPEVKKLLQTPKHRSFKF
jgi:hypothetical protein